MTHAWILVRQELWSLRLPASKLRSLFPAALRGAWRAAKAKAARIAEMVSEVTLPAADIWAQIQNLENKTRLNFQGMQKLNQLNCAYQHARACEQAVLAA
jgi:hypothetical protein